MQEYTYAPLNSGEIRLVNLSGDGCIQIQHARPEEAHYEALSYTWGSEDSVDIQTETGSISIKPNLASALLHLRHVDTRRLWADAISVNQDDLKERGRQVERMGDIFRNAKRVVVWLGVASATSDATLNLLESIGSKITVDWARASVEPHPGSNPNWANPTFALSLDEDQWRGILDLLSRPWFERLWIQQEVRLASDAVVQCGDTLISWNHFTNALFVLRNREKAGLPEQIAEDLYNRAETAYQIRNTAGPRLLINLIRQSSSCKYTDARDKVYAFLSHIQETSLRGKIKPDYSLSVEAVYRDAAKQYICSVGSLSLLVACNPARTLRLPSWVPDWSAPDEASVLGGFIAGGNLACVASFPDDDTLRAAGIYCATITHVSSATIQDNKPIEARSFSDIAVYLQKHVPDTLNEPYIGGGSKLDAYCSAFCCDRFANRYHPPRESFPDQTLSRRELQYYVEWQPGDPERPPDADIKAGRYGAYVYWSTQGRRFFETREGYIGLAPVGAQPGDQVCVFIGCDVPLILRPTGNSYKVVGECFISGFMDSEALYGPFPEGHRFVYWYRDGDYQAAVLNTSTGIASTEDPRYNPSRNSLDILKARGVELRDFELI